MIGISGMVLGMVKCMVGRGITVHTCDMRVGIGMDDIPISVLGSKVYIYDLLWQMESDKESLKED